MIYIYQQLKAEERDLIAIWKGQGVSARGIAQRLGRTNSTVSREIRRNSLYNLGYVAIYAQEEASKRKSLAGKRHPLKNKQVFAYVINRLNLKRD